MSKGNSAEPKLKKYRQKRDFTVTTEPAGGAKAVEARRFVIQEHHATRLHWDLRLELGGVLVSWAVPREPPTEPGIRRLAVHVEDHPVEYGGFEGEIPKGQYGGGTVRIWDHGTWFCNGDPEEQLKAGKLEFALEGDRLRGSYVLIRLKKENDNWLWLKMEHDKSFGLAQAPPAAMPDFVPPELCATAPEPPTGAEWAYEVKWDGYRMHARKSGDDVRLKSRNDIEFSVPNVESELCRAIHRDCYLDGEMVAFDERGISRFGLVKSALSSRKGSGLTYVVFDLMFYDGHDLRAWPLSRRKAELKRILADADPSLLRYSDDVPSIRLEDACRGGLEGLVSKRIDSTYRSGRHDDWVKTRCQQQLVAKVAGYTRMTNSDDAIGALLLGIIQEGSLVYIGRVGTGFSDADRRTWFKKLRAIQQPQPFEKFNDSKRGVTFVEPTHEIAVEYLDWTESGRLRHPTVLKTAPARRQEPMVKITHGERIIDALTGTTKQGVADYYRSVADLVLTYVANRPLPVLRCPEGVDSECFFHKHKFAGKNIGIHDVVLPDDNEPYMAIDELDGLLSLVQMGSVELHPWASTVNDIEHPDRFVFDLDPGDEVKWPDVVRTANDIRALFASLKMDSFVKTTGGKGLHVVVPVAPEMDWDDFKEISRQITDQAVQRAPDKRLANMSKAKRNGRIFIDYLRNGRGATAVAAYSLRARPGLAVSMPVDWLELPDILPTQFNITNAAEHIRTRKEDPWKWYDKAKKQSLRRAMKLS